MLSEWPRGLLLIFAVYTVYAMQPNKSEESGKMYLPDDQGEYVPEVDTPSLSVQGLPDALAEVQPQSEEFALQLW